MPSLVMDSCCCCISVRTGSFIIGYLQLVGEIIFAIASLLFFVLGGAVMADSSSSSHKTHHTIYVQGQEQDTEEFGKALGLVVIIIGAVILLFVAVLLAFTIVLLVGLHKNKRGHVKAFLVYYAVFICIMVILFVVSLINYFDIRTACSSILEILLQVYFLLVIRSHYYKMDETNSNNKGVIYRTA